MFRGRGSGRLAREGGTCQRANENGKWNAPALPRHPLRGPCPCPPVPVCGCAIVILPLANVHSTPLCPFQVPCPITHSLEKRDYVINELVETEKKYVDVLSTLQRSFMRPLSLILKDDDMKIVFHGIKVILL